MMVLNNKAPLNGITGGDKEKQDGIKTVLSNFVGTTGQISNLLIRDLKAVCKFSSDKVNY
jgi:hypothetical protein